MNEDNPIYEDHSKKEDDPKNEDSPKNKEKGFLSKGFHITLGIFIFALFLTMTNAMMMTTTQNPNLF